MVRADVDAVVLLSVQVAVQLTVASPLVVAVTPTVTVAGPGYLLGALSNSSGARAMAKAGQVRAGGLHPRGDATQREQADRGYAGRKTT